MTTVSVSEQRPGIAVVRIDNPPANALTYEMRLEILETWRRLRDDDAIRAVVVTGSGDSFFCAGLDLEELRHDLRGRDPNEIHDRIDRLHWDPASADLWKPTIAAINGYCLAGGWYLAQMCDVRIATEDARFGIPEARWGLPAVFAWELPRLVPLNFALEAVLWADRQFTAARLFQVGWLNAVVRGSALLDVALDWGSEVAALPPESVRAHKQLLWATASAGGDRIRSAAETLVRGLYDAPNLDAAISDFLARGDVNTSHEVGA